MAIIPTGEERARASHARSRFLAAFGMTDRKAKAKQDAESGYKGDGVAADDGGGGVGEPEEGEGNGDGSDGWARAEECQEEEGNPGSGEEFGEGGPLEGAKEHVGVGEIEGRGDECGVGAGEVAGYFVEGEAGGEQSDGDEDRGAEGDGEDEREDGSEQPGERRIEEETGLTSVPGGGDVPVWVEGAVAKLLRCVEPALDVEGEILAAGGTVDEKRVDGEQDGDGDQQQRALGCGGLSGGRHELLCHCGLTGAGWGTSAA